MGDDPRQTVLIAPSGMLGTCWAAALDEVGEPWTPLDFPGFDLTNPEHLARIPASASLVINAAAYTDVDGAERDETAAAELNGAAVGRLADRCKDIGALLLHYSTDYVFDGQAATPYPRDHHRDPRSAYGRTKLAGERALETAGAEFLCIRTSWLYAPHGKNFVRTIAGLAADKTELRVVADQRGRPTSAANLVRTSQRLLDAGARGFYHASDAGDCTWHELAQAIAERVNPDCRVDPCATDEFPRDAERPPYSVLDLSATETLAGPLTHWRDALSDVLDQLLESPEQREPKTEPRKAS